MKKDAHYYAILAFCRACGFNKEAAHQVAFASQFVDDAKINHIVLKEDPGNTIEYDTIDSRPSFFNMATCHSYTRIKTFNYNAMINNTCAFHFVPGCKGKLFPKKLRCSEATPVIEGILNEAINENDLVKLGMVLHPYADSFSHQGFSGLLSKVNDIDKCKSLSKTLWGRYDKIKGFFKWFLKNRFDKFFDLLMPAYGHGQAFDYPDIPHLPWSYEYDYSDRFSESYKNSELIKNSERFRRAFTKIKEYLEAFLVKHPEHQDQSENIKKIENLEFLFDALLSKKTDNGREKNWRNVMIRNDLFKKGETQLKYDKNRWLKAAFSNFDKKKFNQRKVEGARLASHFSDSNWYKYFLAVKWYKNKFYEHCSRSMLNIPR